MTPALFDSPASSEAEFLLIVDELTRRGFLAGSGAALALGLTACSSNSRPAASATTRTVDAVQGPVQVPTHPGRVVALDHWATNACFDLGITPVSVADNIGSLVPEKYQHTLAGVPTYGLTYQPNIEKIAATQPDLILMSNVFAKATSTPMDKLADIAPVVVAEYKIPADNPVLAFASNYATFADALNRSAQLSGLRSKFDAKLDGLRTDHGATIASHRWASILVWEATSVAVQNVNTVGDLILSGLGAKWTSAAPHTRDGNATTLSMEQIGQLEDADVILTVAGSDASSLAALKANPLFQRLPAVRVGHFYSPSADWPVGYTGAEEFLDQLRDLCTEL